MNKDKKGPEGKGPLTGRGLGNCKKEGVLGEPIEFLGRGLGRGRGKGLGRKRRR